MVFKPQTFHGDDAATYDAKVNPTSADEARVADALARAGTLDASNISVTSVGSTVVLQGTVAFPQEIAEAHEVASRVAGITSVENLVTATHDNNAQPN
jgi:osmotically-inducible protein OsmY